MQRFRSSFFVDLLSQDNAPHARASLALIEELDERTAGLAKNYVARNGMIEVAHRDGYDWIEIFRIHRIRVAGTVIEIGLPNPYAPHPELRLGNLMETNLVQFGFGVLVDLEHEESGDVRGLAECLRDLNLMLQGVPWIQGLLGVPASPQSWQGSQDP